MRTERGSLDAHGADLEDAEATPDTAPDADDAPVAEDAAGADAGEVDEVQDTAGDDEEADAADEEEGDFVPLVSNEDWVYRRVDRLVERLPQRHGHDRRTEGEVFDRPTLMTLHRLLTHGVLKSLDFPVSTGKEANVFRGTTPEGGYVAVKIYRINTSTFKHVLQYIQGDERFEGVAGDKKALVHAWAQKEFRNLHRLRHAGVDVPEPIRVMNNVLVMEYLGVKAGPWPRMKDLGRLPDPQRFWRKLVDDYLRMHNEAGLIHADFSEFNVLVEHADDPALAVPRIIDVGQAVLRNHPMSAQFLRRDVENLVSYFRRQGVRDAAPEQISGRLRSDAPDPSEPSLEEEE